MTFSQTEMAIPHLCPSGYLSPVSDVCLPTRMYSPQELTKAQNNIIHRKVFLMGDVTTFSCFVGKSVTIRGDIAKVSIGEGVFIDEGALIRPPLRLISKKLMAESVPVAIGHYVYIGANVICEAMSIGNFVIIESNSVIGERCVISHGAQVRAGSVLPSGMVVSPFTIIEGNPARIVGRVPEDIHPNLVRELISQHFQSLFS